MKDRVEELCELISVAERQAAKARERGANEVALSYAGAERRWRAERERLLKHRQRTSAPGENNATVR